MRKLYIENIEHECAIPDERLEFLNYAYAHGDLERKVGFDLLSVDRNDHFDKRKNYDGERFVAVLPNGEEVQALLFYWRTVRTYVQKLQCGEIYRQTYVMPHGLLVAETDIASIEHARKCFNERRTGV